MFDTYVEKFVVVLVLNGVLISPKMNEGTECELDETTVPAGSLGQTHLFPWLGILKARLHGIDAYTEFITTIVMVKDGFALVIADDVARMPKYIFRGFVSVMFLSEADRFWYCRLLDFVTHPEYDEEDLANTIAIVQLELLQESFPVKPVCLPYESNGDDISNHLFAVLYDDKNMKLQKTIHAMRYKDTKSCEEFYIKRRFTQPNLVPRHMQCASATHILVTCVWEAGVALISNATGPWMLLGLGTKSMGCANPTRFINIIPYITWIDRVTNVDNEHETQYRRTAFNEGFGKEREPEGDIGETASVYHVTKNSFTFKNEAQQSEQDNSPHILKRISQNEIFFFPGIGLRNCDSNNSNLIYHDEAKIQAPNMGGSLKFKIIMYNEHYFNQICMRIKLKAKFTDTAAVYLLRVINRRDRQGDYLADFDDALKIVVPPSSQVQELRGRSGIELRDFLEAEQHHITYQEKEALSYSGDPFYVLLRLDFEYDAVLDVQVLEPFVTSTITQTAVTTTKSTAQSDVIAGPLQLKFTKIDTDEAATIINNPLVVSDGNGLRSSYVACTISVVVFWVRNG